MSDKSLVDRLSSLPNLADVPREELEWLAERGTLEVYEAGQVTAPMGRRITKMWVILSGHVTVRVDRGVGPRRVIEWHAGELSGMLPYSRMKSPPGHNFAERRAEMLAIPEDLFPEMIRRCPTITALAVHSMLDRARSFNTSDLQDEKMVSLGRLAAGLAHELNNPASATVRAAKLLLDAMAESEAASRALAAVGPTLEQLEAIERLRTSCVSRPTAAVLSPIQQADREETILEWMEAHGTDPGAVSTLAETPITIEDLDRIAAELPPASLAVVLQWIAAGCTASALALDIERAATRISELVGAVKRFTHMDARSGPESVDVRPGLQDTLRVMAAKAKSKGASVTIEVEPDLPRVRANGGELNQIWMNLIDNALDAIAESGHIAISARREVDRVVVRVVDDGSGIPADVLPRIFDPFFTTKSPGQGTGLGLEISRRLARSYRGEVTAASEPGRTELTVSLPIDTGEQSIAAMEGTWRQE